MFTPKQQNKTVRGPDNEAESICNIFTPKQHKAVRGPDN